MDIWLIEEGEKTGPFPDYRIRERLAAGSLPPHTPAWHEGRDGWAPLSEMPLLVRAAQPPPLPRPQIGNPAGWPQMWKRFFARWFDLKAYTALWWLVMWVAGADLKGIFASSWILPLVLLPWFAIEAAWIHLAGTTPGKFLMGLRVLNEDGSRLTPGQSVRRALRVMILGVGFGWSLLAVICQALSAHTTLRLRRALWDQAGGHRVVEKPPSVPLILLLALGFPALMMVESWVTFPYLAGQMIESFPQVREFIVDHPFYRPLP